jgi:EAL domain-containing protein (putative c-di-GMP-specific phosphodiesterase class I)
MHRAKQIGRNNFQFYTTSLNTRSAEKLLLESDLRRALERREFVLHYQPKVGTRDGRLEGFEALIRWKKADGSIVPPGAFIPLLEESGLIVEVGAWVVRAACAQLREWQRAGLQPVPIAVNVSAKQFLRTDLPALIGTTVREFGVEPSLLEIEITESDVMEDPARVVPTLRTLHEMGVNTAIDDFGTGYSSLSYLAKLPIQALKIDRSFIAGMQEEANELTLVSTMISLAHTLRLKVIAEGVETEEQAKLLALLRCDLLQGYLRGRPMPAADCTALLHSAPVKAEKAAA